MLNTKPNHVSEMGKAVLRLLLTIPWYTTVVHSGHLFPKPSHNTKVSFKVLCCGNFSQHNNLQESCAIAKMTARCALYN